MTAGRYTVIESCRGCGEALGDPTRWLEMEPMPLAGAFSPTPESARDAAIYPLTLIGCPRCRLVQVREDVSGEELFSEYRYSSSTVPGLVRHFDRYADELLQLLGNGKARVLEIGCNDGVLLSRLPRSWDLTGVDPSDVAAAGSRADYRLISAPFTPALAMELAEAGPFDLVTSSNTLAHLSDLAGAFEGIAHLLGPEGLFVMEVHDLDATLASGQWDTVYHEHKVEWSEASLRTCLARAGLGVVQVERLPLHGGALRVTSRPCAPERDRATLPDDVENAGLRRLRASYEARRLTPLYRRLMEVLDKGGVLCAYGASGRANVWLNQLSDLDVAFVADDSPLRMGTWLPRVAIAVVGATRLYESSTDGCLVTAWNHAQDIVERHPGYRGAWFPTFTSAA